MVNLISGALFSEMVIEAAYAINVKKQELNDLNVFPVPDGDTGINMSMTIDAAAAMLKNQDPKDLGSTADAVAMSMLRGARGNSGVILSLLFRGFAKKVRGSDQADPLLFAEALSEGVASAYKAVARPAEGTILTVSRRAAEAAIEAAETTDDLLATLESAVLCAHEALVETTQQNPVLKKAGVVDAGGAGFEIILNAMLALLKGEAPVHEKIVEDSIEASPFDAFDTEDINFTYCTEFIIERSGIGNPSDLRQYLMSIGDCVVVVDDEEIIKVHVHSNEPGNVIQKALELGSLDKIKIENMKIQHTQKLVQNIPRQSSKTPESDNFDEEQKDFGIVAVSAGDGLRTAFQELGADRVVDGGQTMNPSTETILQAVESIPTNLVYIFPNNKNIIMAAQQVQPLTEKKVIVVPTRTVAQGISALLVFDSEKDPESNASFMEETAQSVHTGEITYAARNSVFDDKQIKEGDFLTLLDSKLVDVQTHRLDAVQSLANSMKECEASYITVIYGADADEEEAEIVSRIFSETLDNAEVSTLCGGQPVYSYIVSAE